MRSLRCHTLIVTQSSLQQQHCLAVRGVRKQVNRHLSRPLLAASPPVTPTLAAPPLGTAPLADHPLIAPTAAPPCSVRCAERGPRPPVMPLLAAPPPVTPLLAAPPPVTSPLAARPLAKSPLAAPPPVTPPLVAPPRVTRSSLQQQHRLAVRGVREQVHGHSAHGRERRATAGPVRPLRLGYDGWCSQCHWMPFEATHEDSKCD